MKFRGVKLTPTIRTRNKKPWRSGSRWICCAPTCKHSRYQEKDGRCQRVVTAKDGTRAACGRMLVRVYRQYVKPRKKKPSPLVQYLRRQLTKWRGYCACERRSGGALHPLLSTKHEHETRPLCNACKKPRKR